MTVSDGIKGICQYVNAHKNQFKINYLVRIIYLMLNHVDTLAFPITLKIGLFSDIHHINGTPHMGRSLRSF